MEMTRALELTVYAVLRILPYLLLMYYVFRNHFRFPKWVIAATMAAITALRCVCGFVPYWDADKMNDPNPGILIFAVLTVVLVKGHWGKGLFTMLMLANVSAFAVTAAKYLEGLFFSGYVLELHRWTNSLTLLLVEAAVLLPLFFYIKNFYMKALRQTISMRSWSLLWLVPFTFYTVWYRNSFFASENHELLSLDLKYVFFAFLVNGGGMLIYTLVARLINEHAENDRLREREMQILIKQKQFETLQERIDEARAAKHDMRQHLHMISAYLEDEKYGELKAYINRFRKTVPENITISYCAHYGIDALLQYFAGLARENGIAFSARMELPAKIGIPDDVLAVLMGNLLENAVEACAKEAKPVISIRSQMQGNAVFFKIVNTFTGKAKKSPDGLYLSSKHEGRGIGLRSVRGIVEDYKGILKITQEDGLFTVSVLVNTNPR